MRSMTGFGQAAGENGRLRINITLRGVNHRFLDLSLRLREEWRCLEVDLRERLSNRLHRGRVEFSLDAETLMARAIEVKVNEEAIAALHERHLELHERGWVESGLHMGDLMRSPDVLRFESQAPEWGEDDQALVFEVVEQALDQLVQAREIEGEKLSDALEQRIEGLVALTQHLGQRAAQLPAEIAASLHRRITELVDTPDLDPNRLSQEVALLVDRSDVSEEIDRLGSHLEHFRSILEQQGSLGKRLDFLAQEIFRELNTIGTKCRDSEMTRWVLDAKVLCEQLREQIQNVE